MTSRFTTERFNIGDRVRPSFPAKRARIGWIRAKTSRGYVVHWLGIGEGDGWSDDDLAKADAYVAID